MPSKLGISFSVFFVMVSIGSTSLAFYRCTEWTKQSGVTCIFGTSDAKVYKRQCENPCGYYDGPYCDREEVCYFSDPTAFNKGCSPWHKVSGVTCYDPNSEDWGSKWVRSCTVGLREEWCSDSDPNLL